MDAALWMFLPLFVAAGSAMISYVVMKARMEVLLAKEREQLIAVRTQLESQEQILQERIRTTEEAAQRRAFDSFLADFRVEERHYLRENKSLFMNKKAMVLQERLYFRNIPLSNWIEHEMPVEEGSDLPALVQSASSFNTKGLGQASSLGAKLLQLQ